MLTFSERLALIKNALREKGLSQKDVAEALNSNQAKVSLALSGTKEVPMEFLLELLRESEYPIEKVFPTLQRDLKDIVALLEKGASQQATVNLLNLMKLTNHYDRPQEDTQAAS
jgi:transcriptional regulator with XRE-family HTH domain